MPRLVLLRAVVLAAVFILTSVNLSALASTETAVGTGKLGFVAAESPAIVEAIRVRTILGLDTDLTLIRSLATTSASSTVFGVPLLPDEEILLVERVRIQNSLGRLHEYAKEHPDLWGGMWLSYPTGGTPAHASTLNVALTSAPASVLDALEPLVPSGADLNVIEVVFTEAELDAQHADIMDRSAAFAAARSELYSVRTEVQENRLVAVVSTLTPGLSSLTADLPAGMVRFESGGPAIGDACSRTACGPPWRAGLKIYRNTWSEYCTANFINTRYVGVWVYSLWTAGHCPSGTWHLGSPSGTVIGSTTTNYFTNGSNVDVQRISISNGTQDDDYLYGTAACTSCVQTDLTLAESASGDTVGEMLLNNGAVSGSVSGTLLNRNVSLTYLGVPLTNLRRSNYTRQPGDSGGPVVRIHNVYYGAYDVAAGSHTHYQVIDGYEYPFYTHVSTMAAISGYSVYTSGD